MVSEISVHLRKLAPATSPLHELRPTPLGPRQLPRRERQRHAPRGRLVADRTRQYALRREVLPHPQRGRGRHERLVPGLQERQALARRQPQREEGLLERPGQVDAHVEEPGHGGQEGVYVAAMRR